MLIKWKRRYKLECSIMNELEPTLRQNNQERAEKLDNEWFEDFIKNGKIEPPLLLSGEKKYRAAQKEAFLAGEIENPSLDYPEFDLDDLAKREGNLRELKRQVRLSVDDTDEAAFVESREARVVRQAYLWRINESIASIGLLRAAAEGEKRDFRGVYEIMEKYFYLSNLLKDQDSEKAREKAQTSAWKRCVRTFRGSDCKTPGVCFTKDIAYREGQIGVWQVVADSPDEVRRFSIGKYDPANDRHIWILDQLGITDDDLEKLEK